jgi:hypothetical protein
MKPSEELQKELEKKFLSPEKFTKEIEKLVSEREDLNYITAITEYCEDNNIEVDSITKLISPTLKERIKGDALRLNFLKRTSKARLPL